MYKKYKIGRGLRGNIGVRRRMPMLRRSLLRHIFGAINGVRSIFGEIPARGAIAVFTLLIFIETFLLGLPISTQDGNPTVPIDAFFTAISSICVTGLAVVDMGHHWSLFGNVVIVCGMQIGALGVLTIAAIMGVSVTRRLGVKQRLMVASEANPMKFTNFSGSDSDAVNLGDMKGLLFAIVTSTLAIETGLLLLTLPKMLAEGYGFWTALGYSVYFSASSFTNTGFTPLPDGLTHFSNDPYMLGVLMLGVIVGGLGFPVILSLWRYFAEGGWRARQSIGLHVKLTLVTSGILLVSATVLIWVLEHANPKTMGHDNFGEAVLHSLFLSVMPRSGGFTVTEISDLRGSTHLVIDMLMFIGGGFASTAGGIKVTTLAVLLLAAWAEARGLRDVQAFERRIPTGVLRVAIAVVIWATVLVATSTITISALSNAPLDRVLMDVISAFGSCGISSGLAAELDVAGKIALGITAWAGKIGTVTLAAAVASTNTSQLYRFPVERPTVG